MEKISLLAVGVKSATVPVLFEIHKGHILTLRMKLDAEEWRDFSGKNLFKCLLDARAVLEKTGLLLCCQGARPDVFPSGMQQQMEIGRFAHILETGRKVYESVDIFAPADASDVVSVEQQRVAVYRFFGLSLTSTAEAAGTDNPQTE